MNSTQKTILAAAAVATVFIASWLLVAGPVSDEKHGQVGLASIEQASENSRIIAELEKSVEILDKRVNEALELAKYRLRTLRFIPVVVTPYNPVVAQTGSTPQITAPNNPVRPGIGALSRDLEAEFGLNFRDPVVIEGLGNGGTPFRNSATQLPEPFIFGDHARSNEIARAKDPNVQHPESNKEDRVSNQELPCRELRP